ncbi:WHG domain protein [Leptospira ryugenii]|uniref:WHG domain protein n=1 Tax=Leptospira ryugenii TaxID=1917863 RepID=A0A2P2DYG8_9LEPT|nr:TetR/AcrR family transcriptional regulator [Leptospira ryugenii]GBF49679.1 WHG domain protein [Leptospira ryugenii]
MVRMRKSYHHGNLRDAILKESLLWIKKEGIETLSLREIAKKLGVTHSAPNKHFPKKEVLLANMVEHGFIQFRIALLEGCKNLETEPREAFQSMCLSYIKFANDNPEIYRLMFSKTLDDYEDYPACQKAGFASFQVLLDAVNKLQEGGIIKQGDIREISFLLWSLIHGYVLLWQEGRIEGLKTKMEGKAEKLSDTHFFISLMNHLNSSIFLT